MKQKEKYSKKKKFIIGSVVLLTPLFCFIAFVLLGSNPLPPNIKDDESIKVACIGDSITQGNVFISRDIGSSYPIELQKLLGDKYQVLSYGLYSRTASQLGD